MPKSTDIVLAYDLGGTKVALGVVNGEGTLLHEERHPVPMHEGKEAVLKLLISYGQAMIQKFPEIGSVGVASAGPLNPVTGELLDPHNFASPKGRWGLVPLGNILEKGLGRKVFVDNDAAAAILAEHWQGAAKGYANSVVLTLGTGLGVGVICNGNLVRGGRDFHPEGGHILLSAGAPDALCGCGNYGCAEAYLSGRSFGRRSAAKLNLDPTTHPAHFFAEHARTTKNPEYLALFEDYAHWLAYACLVFVRLYYPEVIVLTGSFAQASDLFLETAQKKLEPLLAWNHFGPSLKPKLTLSTLENKAGVLGGAWLALNFSSQT